MRRSEGGGQHTHKQSKGMEMGWGCDAGVGGVLCVWVGERRRGIFLAPRCAFSQLTPSRGGEGDEISSI